MIYFAGIGPKDANFDVIKKIDKAFRMCYNRKNEIRKEGTR